MKEHQKELCVAFIDFTKAFDRVNHHEFIEIMTKVRIPFHEKRLITYLYWNQTAAVKYVDELTSEIDIRLGVRQWCVLSPILFNLYSEKLIEEVLDDDEVACFNGRRIQTVRYADDTAVVADSELRLQTMMNKIKTKCEEFGLKLNERRQL